MAKADYPPHLPIVHLNGTRKEVLVNDLLDTRSFLFDAIQRYESGSPNMRDYYPESGRIDKALVVYRQRLADMKRIYNELGKDAEHIQDS